MTILFQNEAQEKIIRKAYQDYYEPLRLLEEAFRASGMEIIFELTLSENGYKWISIDEGIRPPNTISIEGCNPAMAVMQVAAAVRL